MDGEWQTVIAGVCNDRCLIPLSLNKLNNQYATRPSAKEVADT